jgi:hypothetical protein
VTVTCPQSSLAADETVVCTASATAVGGPYANVGTATAELPAGGIVSASDPSHYVGTLIRIEKSTNDQDADAPPGPVLAVGAAVAWTYEVTNFSGETISEILVEDDQGVTVTCPATTLADGESMICTAAGTAEAGQYANIGTVTAMLPDESTAADSDPSHYFGQGETVDFGDAADPPYLTLFASNGARHLLGSGVYLGACVDSEIDGQPNATATGDDAGAGLLTFGTCAVAGDDEDGVVFPSTLVAGQTGEVDVVANEACTLSAWIDFLGNGDWSDAGESLFPGGQALAAGLNELTFPIPAGRAPVARRALAAALRHHHRREPVEQQRDGTAGVPHAGPDSPHAGDDRRQCGRSPVGPAPCPVRALARSDHHLVAPHLWYALLRIRRIDYCIHMHYI